MSRKTQAESQKFSVFNQIHFPREFKYLFGNIGLLLKKKHASIAIKNYFILSLKLS